MPFIFMNGLTFLMYMIPASCLLTNDEASKRPAHKCTKKLTEGLLGSIFDLYAHVTLCCVAMVVGA